MCDFRVDAAEICARFDIAPAALSALLADTAQAFDGLLQQDETGLSIPPDARALTRMIARHLDAYDLSKAGHSPAI